MRRGGLTGPGSEGGGECLCLTAGGGGGVGAGVLQECAADLSWHRRGSGSSYSIRL